MSSPRTSKTVLGTLRFARVPRTVFEVLGLHLFQDPSEKGGVLAQDQWLGRSFREIKIVIWNSSGSYSMAPAAARTLQTQVNGGFTVCFVTL